MPAVILAAGGSRRLGRPKQLVRIAEETLLARTIRVVLECGAGPVFVVLGAHAEAIASAVDLSRVRLVLNPDWEQGIASSICAGVEAVQRLTPRAVMLLVCDQPRLTAGHLREMVEVYEGATEPAMVASRYAGIAGIPAIFPASEFARLLSLRGDAGARYLLNDPDGALVAVDFEGGSVDMDTPEDLAGRMEA